MPHISNKPLSKKLLLKIYSEFSSTLLGNKVGKPHVILGEILTSTEKIMMAKRLSIILLLGRGYSYYAISKYLHVSDSTVARFDKERHMGSFNAILNISSPKKKNFVISMVQALIDPRLVTGNVEKIFDEHLRGL